MGLTATNKGNYTPPPADVHLACCVGVYDMGTQVTNFGAKKQVKLVWELDCLKDNGQRYTISKDFTPSMNEKAALRKLIESWSGKKLTDEQSKEFDIGTLLGKSCQLQVIHNGEYANVGAIIKLPANAQPMKPVSPLVSYDMDRDGRNIPDGTPEFVKKKILAAQEWELEEATAQTAKFDSGSVASQAAAVF